MPDRSVEVLLNIGRFPSFTMAFQPIVDVSCHRVWAYEALVRGRNGASASAVFSKVPRPLIQHFELLCRHRAIEMASQLFRAEDRSLLSLNLSPTALGSVYACVPYLVDRVNEMGFHPSDVIIEFTEGDHVADVIATSRLAAQYKDAGFLTALDDFGAGYSGLTRLAAFPADFLKIDMELVRGIDKDSARQIIVSGLIDIAQKLSSELIAEGVETAAEFHFLQTLGIRLFQGYHFAKPAINALPKVGFATSLQPVPDDGNRRQFLNTNSYHFADDATKHAC